MGLIIAHSNSDCKIKYYSQRLEVTNRLCHKRDMKFRLQQLRLDRGFTQTEVAERLGLSQGMYNQLESGKRRVNEDHISALAKLYGVSPVQLIVDPDRDDPLYQQLDEAFRLLSESERKILVDSAKGILAGRAGK